jgi:dienelactone hydrolase
VCVTVMYPEKDEYKGFSDLSSAQALSNILKQGGKVHEFNVYTGASHAFANHLRPEVYHPKHAELALARTAKWFDQHLS